MATIVTFGSATWDAFSELEKGDYRVIEDDKFLTKKAICFPLGSKVIIDKLNFFSGGGGTNTAATFAKQGFEVSYLGRVGNDGQGTMVLEELEEIGVDISMVVRDKERPTAFSLILPTPQGKRSILAYRGACHFMREETIPWSSIKKADWFYIAPLSGESVNLFKPLIKFAREQNIKIALNPSISQVEMIKNSDQSLLGDIDLLVLNNEEAALLTDSAINQEERMLKIILESLKGVLAITSGVRGALASDKENIFKAPIAPVTVRACTGAGDAFASGFLSGLLEKNDIEYAIRLAILNAAGCVSKVGAKEGLLKKGEAAEWPPLKIVKNKINF